MSCLPIFVSGDLYTSRGTTLSIKHNHSNVTFTCIYTLCSDQLHVHVHVSLPSSEKERNEGTRKESIEVE